MVLIYIITCCVLSENGPNLDFVEKGHILPLMGTWQVSEGPDQSAEGTYKASEGQFQAA